MHVHRVRAQIKVSDEAITRENENWIFQLNGVFLSPCTKKAQLFVDNDEASSIDNGGNRGANCDCWKMGKLLCMHINFHLLMLHAAASIPQSVNKCIKYSKSIFLDKQLFDTHNQSISSSAAVAVGFKLLHNAWRFSHRWRLRFIHQYYVDELC